MHRLLRRCLGKLLAQILDFGLELDILVTELIYRVFELAILAAEGYDFTIHCGEVLDEAFVLRGEDIDGVLHRL